MNKDIYQYIVDEESNFKTQSVPVTDSKEWNMYEHIQRCTNVANGWFHKGKNDGNRPYKNIVTPILNVARRSEGFDVKDIEPFVNDPINYYKSFIVRKYHAIWARKNSIDTFVDELVENSIIYDLALIKNVNDVRPEVVPLQQIAFCDQTDVMSGPICIRHEYTPDQLLEFAGKWNEETINKVIAASKDEKSTATQGNTKTKTPGKYIEVYELHGTLPEKWLKDDGDTDKYTGQMQIITFAGTDKDKSKSGETLFRGPEKESIFKALVINKIFGRACGLSSVEQLFEDQVWTNYNEIKIKAMLDTAALILLQTSDPGFSNRNNLNDLQAGVPEVLMTAKGESVTQINAQPMNMTAFTNAVIAWENHARVTGSASDAQLGTNPVSGTPFALQSLIVQQGQGIHEWRQGKIATFVSEIYRDWILDYLVKEINTGKKFMDKLSLEELQEVTEAMVTKAANNRIKEGMFKNNGLGGELVTPEMVEERKNFIREGFKKGGNKKFFEIAKDELKDLPVDVEINVAGKQKNLAKNADSLTNIFRQIIAAPQVLQLPGMGKLFNEIIENSGFSPMDFTDITKMQPVQPAQPAPQLNNQITQQQ